MMITTLEICVRDPLSYRSTTAKGSKGDASTTEVIGVSIGKTHVTVEGESARMMMHLMTAISSTSVGIMMR
eukprot:3007834-Amphidinium_carterae.1